jgi:hypothetical protein
MRDSARGILGTERVEGVIRTRPFLEGEDTKSGCVQVNTGLHKIRINDALTKNKRDFQFTAVAPIGCLQVRATCPARAVFMHLDIRGETNHAAGSCHARLGSPAHALTPYVRAYAHTHAHTHTRTHTHTHARARAHTHAHAHVLSLGAHRRSTSNSRFTALWNMSFTASTCACLRTEKRTRESRTPSEGVRVQRTQGSWPDPSKVRATHQCSSSCLLGGDDAHPTPVLLLPYTVIGVVFPFFLALAGINS